MTVFKTIIFFLHLDFKIIKQTILQFQENHLKSKFVLKFFLIDDKIFIKTTQIY